MERLMETLFLPRNRAYGELGVFLAVFVLCSCAWIYLESHRDSFSKYAYIALCSLRASITLTWTRLAVRNAYFDRDLAYLIISVCSSIVTLITWMKYGWILPLDLLSLGFYIAAGVLTLQCTEYYPRTLRTAVKEAPARAILAVYKWSQWPERRWEASLRADIARDVLYAADVFREVSSKDLDAEDPLMRVKDLALGQALLRKIISEQHELRSVCERVWSGCDQEQFAHEVQQFLDAFNEALPYSLKPHFDYRFIRSDTHTEARKWIIRCLCESSTGGWVQAPFISSNKSDELLESQGAAYKNDKEAILEQHLDCRTWLTRVLTRPDSIPSEFDDPANVQQYFGTYESDERSFAPPASEFIRILPVVCTPFRELFLAFFLHFLPLHLREVFQSIPVESMSVLRYSGSLLGRWRLKSGYWHWESFSSSIANEMKRLIEGLTSSRWNWWPLTGFVPSFARSHTRLSWQCTCGKREWLDTSLEVEVFLELLRESCIRPDSRSIHWCRSRTMWEKMVITSMREIYTLRSSSLQMYFATLSRAEKKYSPSTIPPPDSSSSASQSVSNPEQSKHPAAEGSPTSGPNLVPQALSRRSTSLYSAANHNHVLIGVTNGKRHVKPDQIQVGDNTSDSDFFRQLRIQFRAQRAWWKRWLSIWQLDHCVVVKFSRLGSQRMAREHRDLPTSLEYVYDPRAPAVDAQNPPLSSHLFEALYNSCSDPCKKRLPHECSVPPNGQTYIDRFPKREREFVNDLTSPIWGLEPVYAISAFRVLLYHVVLVLAPFGFFGWWVATRPDDLQNASVPATFALAFISLFWMLSDILTNKRND